MAAYELSTKFVRKSTMFRKEKEGGLVFNHKRKEIVRLNNTGYFLWEMLDGSNTVADVVKALAARTNTDESIVAQDVDKYLVSLEGMKLIEQTDDELVAG